MKISGWAKNILLLTLIIVVFIDTSLIPTLLIYYALAVFLRYFIPWIYFGPYSTFNTRETINHFIGTTFFVSLYMCWVFPSLITNNFGYHIIIGFQIFYFWFAWILVPYGGYLLMGAPCKECGNLNRYDCYNDKECVDRIGRATINRYSFTCTYCGEDFEVYSGESVEYTDSITALIRAMRQR